jgi:hypothetical protein
MFQECRHIKASGNKCESPALKDKAYCYYHHRAYARSHRAVDPHGASRLEIPLLEDRSAVQMALSEVVEALAGHRIDLKRAGLMIYALQVASSNAKKDQGFISEDQVREAFFGEQGQDLAPEITGYDFDDDIPDDAPRKGEPSLADLLQAEIRRQNAEAAKRSHCPLCNPAPEESISEQDDGSDAREDPDRFDREPEESRRW